MSEIFLLLLLGALVLIWQSGARSKEQAVVIAKRECLRKQLQLLDQTVVLDHLRLHRGAEGWLVIWRHYRFDYTDTGEVRYQGQLSLSGRRLVRIDLEDDQVIIH